jgi:hypothetical protein
VPAPPQKGKPVLGEPPPNDESASIRAQREKEELEDETKSIEEDLEELKARYDMYFLGVERREPTRERTELKRRVMKVKEAFTRNTGLKFRIQTLHARFLSYERMWMRSAREKEEGTYRRDLFKARLRSQRGGAEQAAEKPIAASAKVADRVAAKPGAPQPAAKAGTAPIPTPDAPLAGQKPVPAQPRPPVAPAPGAPRVPTPAPAGAMSDAAMRRLYDQYMAAKRSCNEDVSRISYDAVASTVSKQIPEIMTRFKAKSVEFKVEVKDGKAVLKAVPKV